MIPIIIAILAALLALCIYAFSQTLLVRRYTLHTDKLAAPVRFSVITDLHGTRYGEGQTELIAAVRREKPDAVFFVGDIVDDPHALTVAEPLFAALGAEFPCYYVTGNHEYSSGAERDTKSMLQAANIVLLQSEVAMLDVNGQQLCIAGVNDPELYGGYSLFGSYAIPAQWRAEYDACQLAAAESGAYSVLLSHRPELTELYRQSGFGLVLSGHAHGGQVRIPGILNGLFAPCQGWFPNYAGGRYALDGTELIVSRGLCRNNLPRVFNRPELVIVTVRPQS